MPVARLAPGRQRRVAAGHPWIYETDIARLEGRPEPGDTVEVVDSRGHFLGRGFINPRSVIRIRMMTRHPEEQVDEGLIRRRLERAWNYRRRLLPDLACCRVVFAEADFLPGLIVDKFGDVLVIQTLALGIERWKETVVSELDRLLTPRGIYERNDVPVRELEGLPQQKGYLSGTFDPRLVVEENGLKLLVDVAGGQKTGHFLDQRENRAAIRRFAQGARVLDAFCHTGGFALNAAVAGAREVVAVDASADALATAAENARLNGLGERIRFENANAFDWLRAQERQDGHFDLIVLDPPAFAKNKTALEGAYRGYKEINLRALKMLPPGGILVTCSCSYHMTPDLFRQVVADAALDARRRLRLIEERAQAADHPILIGYDESHYLKCLVFEVT